MSRCLTQPAVKQCPRDSEFPPVVLEIDTGPMTPEDLRLISAVRGGKGMESGSSQMRLNRSCKEKIVDTERS